MGPLLVLGVIVALGWWRRPRPGGAAARAAELVASSPESSPDARAAERNLLARAGAALLGRSERPADPTRESGAAIAVGLASMLGVLIAPTLLVTAPALLWWVSAERRSYRRRDHAVLTGVADAIDLVRLCLGAGLVPAQAVAVLARHAPEPIGSAFGQVDAGSGRLADRLQLAVDELGEPARSLISALVASERQGAPVLAPLERMAMEVRDQLRRNAEERARRLPVLMLFPLVGCILPAFLLLSTVPLLAGPLTRLLAGT